MRGLYQLRPQYSVVHRYPLKSFNFATDPGKCPWLAGLCRATACTVQTKEMCYKFEHFVASHFSFFPLFHQIQPIWRSYVFFLDLPEVITPESGNPNGALRYPKST